jgi:hypothetical protein
MAFGKRMSFLFESSIYRIIRLLFQLVKWYNKTVETSKCRYYRCNKLQMKIDDVDRIPSQMISYQIGWMNLI